MVNIHPDEKGSAMFLNDDHDTARIGDRIIAAAIAAILGYWLGLVVGFLVEKVAGSTLGAQWFAAAGYGVYGFLAPARSTALWSEILAGLMGFFSGRR